MRFHDCGKAAPARARRTVRGLGETMGEFFTSGRRAAATFAACLLAACASAPIDLAGGGSSVSDNGVVAVSAQEDLRTASGALRAHAAEGGWRLEESSGLNSFVSRLVGGRAETSANSDAVSAYLRRADDAPARLARDMNHAVVLSDEVAAAARVIVSARAPLSESGLRRDLSETEAALTAMRRARAFFQAAASAASEALEPSAEEAVTNGLGDLDAAIERLSRASDQLAERRWAAAEQQTVS
jgi:hypothetical protein